MIAVDTSTWVAFFEGAAGSDTDLLDRLLENRQACLPPAVLSELSSSPALPTAAADLLRRIPLLEPGSGYWERAGVLRRELRNRRRKAALADVLIAQSCIDHEVRLLSRDADFRSIASGSALELAL